MKSIYLALAVLSVGGLPLARLTVLPGPAYAATVKSGLGDLSAFESIVADTLRLAQTGDLKAAERRLTDYKTAWDASEPKLYPLDKTEWGVVDDASDAALDALRASKPTADDVVSTLTALHAVLHNPAAN